MKLVIVSHKECWATATSPSGYATIGGFPYQMQAISELFAQTTLLVPIRSTPIPAGASPLLGHNLVVKPLPEPVGQDLRRKIAIIGWLWRYLPSIWREVRAGDCVHTPVPGDIGTIGLLVALLQKKPLFVRHCGTWGEPASFIGRILLWLLEHIAGGRNVVMATGGSNGFPSSKNAAITWIASTTLSEAEMALLPRPCPWSTGRPLRLVTVARLTFGKNTQVTLQALAIVRATYPDISLDVVGSGPCLDELKQLATDLNLNEAVVFHGNVSHDQVMHILRQGHLFLFPTRVKEGFPKAVLEAMACGLPVVATAVSVLPHLIGAENGVLLPEPTAAATAGAVLALIADEQRMARMAAGARQASRAYTLEAWQATIAERLEANWGQLRSTTTRPIGETA